MTRSEGTQTRSPMERIRALQARLRERDGATVEPVAAPVPQPWRMGETRDYDERARDRRVRLAGLAKEAGYPALPFGIVGEGRDAWDEFIAEANDERVHLSLGFVGGYPNEYDPRVAREEAEIRAAARAARFLMEEEDEIDEDVDGWRPRRAHDRTP
jgi:hypothetical protein